MVATAALSRNLRLWEARLLEEAQTSALEDWASAGRTRVLREPASSASIRGLEDRLGVALPPSYRAFLLTSDGTHADPFGWVPQGFGFFPADRVAWLSDVNPQLIEMWLELFDTPGDPLAFDGAEVKDINALGRGALVVGTAGEDGLTLLVRATKAKEWQLWTLNKELVVGYRSFRAWLHLMTHSLRVTDLPDALERLRAGIADMGPRIGRMRDPAAVPILAEAVADSRTAWAAIEALGSIGTAAAVAAFEPILQSEHAAVRAGSRVPADIRRLAHHIEIVLTYMKEPAAADLLLKYGKHHPLRVKGDPRTAQAAVTDLVPPHYSGAVTLEDCGDATYLPQLKRAAEDAVDPSARLNIASARLRLGDESARAELQEIASDDLDPRQAKAKRALDRHPPDKHD